VSNKEMRLLVTGGRKYSDKKAVYGILDKLEPTLVIHGGATGADRLAARWAYEKCVPCACFVAPWETAHKAAGPMRNHWMLEYGEPDKVLAFPGGSGTENMIKQAEKAGIKVWRYKP